MDPVQSWLDAKEVRRMAESLMAPPPEVDKSAVDAGYGDDFEGFAETGGGGVNKHLAPDLVLRPDGRPHAQKQFVKPPGVAEGPGKQQRSAAGSALADAKRLAEGSGMLGAGGGDGQVKAGDPIPPGTDSPFKISSDQNPSQTDPLAQQVSPSTHVPELDEWADEDDLPSSAVPEQPGDASPPEIERSVPVSAPEVAEVPAGSEGGRDAALDSDSVARGPFLTRLHQFSTIIRRDLGAKAMFLIDNDGQILLDEVENPKLVQVARTLANASYRASRQTAGAAAVGNLHVKIGTSATLEVIPVESRYGLLILGAIFPAPLGANRVMQVAEVLSKTVEPGR